MSDRKKWALLLTALCLTLAVFMQLPQLLVQMQPNARGVLVQINSDENQYLARIEEVLTGRTAQAAQPYLGDPYVPGLHFALIEQAEGLLFRSTGWRAATVEQVMDSVIPVLLFLVLWAFFRMAGFSRRRSLAGVLLFILPLLYSLNRPVHPRASFLLVLATILLVLLALERRSAVFAIVGGLLLGVLVGVYLWSWMFAWTYVGLLVLWEGIVWWRSHPRSAFLRSRFSFVLLIVFAGVLAAAPFVWHTLSLMHSPFYEEVSFRQGMYLTHQPESWIYTILFFCMSAGLILAARERSELKGKRIYALLVPIAAFIVINQQMVHGHVLAFTSHFTFATTLGAVSTLLLCSLFFNRWLLLPFLCAAVFLCGITYDNRPIFHRLLKPAEMVANQEYALLLPVLDRMPRARILSDPGSSAFIAASTQHDILYSIYLESALMPSEEIARRFCMTVLPLTPVQRAISEQTHLVWPDADAAQRSAEVRQREVRMVEQACAAIDRDPPAALRQYGVTHVLWNASRMPQWDLTRLKVKLEKVGEDPGVWVLYRVVE